MMAFLAKNDLLVLDRDMGRVYRIIDWKPLGTPLQDVNLATVGYRGLLGVAMSKKTNSQSIVFLYYTQAGARDGEDEDEKNPQSKYLLIYHLVGL